MKRVLAAAAAVVLLSVAPASAQDIKATVGIGTGFTVPVGSFGDTNDPNFALNVHITGRITDEVFWRIEAGYDRASTSDEVKSSCQLLGFDCKNDTIKRFVVGAQWNFVEVHETATPYLFFGVGAYNQEFRQSGNPFGLDFTRSVTDFGITFGGGVNWLLGDAWGVGGDLHIHGIFHEQGLDNTWYLAPTGQLFFNF